jgi:hypothetical protein
MVGQKESRLDLESVMNTGKIFLARLSHGAIGEENAHLLGTLLVSKFHQIALKRQEIPEDKRRYFWLYVDEFQNFATPSMAGILSGVRKYRLGLTLAHQELRQLQNTMPDVAGAISANAYTRVYFRVSNDDARKLADGLKSFDAMDLQNLATGEAICRVEKPEFDFNLHTVPQTKSGETAVAPTDRVIDLSRQKYAGRREDVEAEMARSRPMVESVEEKTPPQPKPAAEPVPPRKAPVPSASSEKKPPPAPRAKPAPATEPRSQGRGGPEHVYLQRFIKQFAEGLGYRANIEDSVLGRRGVDVALEKGDRSIACEICLTTDDEHELGNVKKCLAAKFQYVAVVTPTSKRLMSLQKAISAGLSAVELERVRFFIPEDLCSFLQELEIGELNKETTVKGYKVKTTYTQNEREDINSRRHAVAQVVAKAMRRMNARTTTKNK